MMYSKNEQDKFYKIEGCNDEISKWSNDEVLITCIPIYDINKEEVYAMDKMVLITWSVELIYLVMTLLWVEGIS